MCKQTGFSESWRSNSIIVMFLVALTYFFVSLIPRVFEIIRIIEKIKVLMHRILISCRFDLMRYNFILLKTKTTVIDSM